MQGTRAAKQLERYATSRKRVFGRWPTEARFNDLIAFEHKIVVFCGEVAPWERMPKIVFLQFLIPSMPSARRLGPGFR